MAQIFPKWTNKIPLLLGLAAPLAGIVAVGFVWYYFSPRYTDVGYMPKQPVEYSHKLHVGELGLDCRYCHVSVERSAVSNVPSTKTCMNCHTTNQDVWPLFEEQYHDLCRTCHEEKAALGLDGGPPRQCIDCHLGDDLP